jgi:hypothetical protein
MKRTKTLLAIVLAASMPIAGCSATYLGGEYRTDATNIAKKGDPHTLAKGSEWMFFWGLFDSGHFDLNQELKSQLREDECITDLEIKDRLSVGGAFLWIFTLGIISHHSLIATGAPSVINRPAPAESTQPAGYNKSPDFDAGYKDGVRDRELPAESRVQRAGASSDYSEGYREGLKTTNPR